MKLETWERQEIISHVKSLRRFEGWYPKCRWVGVGLLEKRHLLVIMGGRIKEDASEM